MYEVRFETGELKATLKSGHEARTLANNYCRWNIPCYVIDSDTGSRVYECASSTRLSVDDISAI